MTTSTQHHQTTPGAETFIGAALQALGFSGGHPDRKVSFPTEDQVRMARGWDIEHLRWRMAEGLYATSADEERARATIAHLRQEYGL